MRPWLFVQYHGLDIEIEKLTLFTSSTIERLQHHNSNGKVPLLIDDGLEIWDTMAILEYLAEKFPHTRGWPGDASARAIARSISAEMHSSFSALRNELPMNCRRFFPDYSISDDVKTDIARITGLWNHCRAEYASAGPWLFGEFSIADAMYAPVVMRFRSVNVELDTVCRQYCETMHKCDAVQLWIDHGYAETETVYEDELDSPSELIPR